MSISRRERKGKGTPKVSLAKVIFVGLSKK